MNFGEIKTEIGDALARTDSAVVDKIGTWVNRRQKQAAARHNFGFLKGESTVAITVAGGQSYNLTGTFKDDLIFYLLKSDSYVELPIRSRLEMIRRYAPDDDGEPQFVSLEGWDTTVSPPTLKFFVWPPAPDASYTLTVVYHSWPTDLSGTSTNWFTDHFPQVLIAGGVAEGYWFLGAEEQAAPWERRWEYELKKAITHDTNRDLPAEFVLAPRWSVDQTTIRVTDRELWRI